MKKIIHVHLIFEKEDYYFGSLAAIYTVLAPEQLGVKYNTLRNAKFYTQVYNLNFIIESF